MNLNWIWRIPLMAGVVLIVFLVAAVCFGLLLNAVMTALITKEMGDDQSETTRLLRRGPARARQTRFPDCTETEATATAEEKGESQ